MACLCVLGFAALMGSGAPSVGAATDPCPNAQFRLGASAHLPECRAYEMVSPVDKNGGEVLPARKVTEKGDSIFYQSLQGFAGTKSAGVGVPYVASRGDGGWSTRATAPPSPAPALSQNLPGYFGLSDDLSSGIYWSLAQHLPGDEFATPNLYQVDTRSLAMERVSTSNGPVSEMYGPFPAEPAFAGGTPDLSNVVFESTDNRTGETTGMNGKVYEWVDGDLRLVSVLPDPPGGPTSEALHARMPNAWRTFGPQQSITGGGVSRDGSRIFFQVTEGSTQSGEYTWGDLYVREDGQSTTDIGALAGPEKSLFWFAEREHGDWVIFTEGDPALEGKELYRYDLESEVLTEIAPSAEQVLGASDDGERVYFSSIGVLTPDAPNDPNTPRKGRYTF